MSLRGGAVFWSARQPSFRGIVNRPHLGGKSSPVVAIRPERGCSFDGHPPRPFAPNLFRHAG